MGDRPLPPALLIRTRPEPPGADPDGRRPLRIAAVGDLHCDADAPRSSLLRAALAAGVRGADLLLLAGDLTASGTPEQARMVADACSALPIPVVAVLGNHDHDGRLGTEVSAILRGAGVALLADASVVLDAGGRHVGVVGATGRPGHARRHDRAGVAEATLMDAGLRGIADCPFRVVLLHFSPTDSTLVGERCELWPQLSCPALAGPIVAHRPDLVVHAHAHSGAFRGAVGDVPVFNVSRDLLRGDVCVLELGAGAAGTARAAG